MQEEETKKDKYDGEHKRQRPKFIFDHEVDRQRNWPSFAKRQKQH